MIEATIISYLTSALDGVSVYAEEPEDKTNAKPYIVITKTGGDIDEYLKSSQIVVDCYAETKVDTITLNDTVIDAMLGIISLDDITSCELNSNYDDTDTTTKEYRYGALFDIKHY